MISEQALGWRGTMVGRMSAKVLSWLWSWAQQVSTGLDKNDGERADAAVVKASETGPRRRRGTVSGLFPKRHNVDARLDLQASVVACSIDLSTLQSPISMTRTPEGTMEWKLNAGAQAGTPTQSSEEPLSPRSSSSAAQLKDEDGDELSKERFVCHYCDAEFRIRGYLTRHIKKHAVEKAYHCPFFNSHVPPETRCHTTGGFSRRDTYKTHLRSRHFIYPEGVKTQDRGKSCGHCAHCGKWFENTSTWIEKHIESGYCTGLPEGTILPAKSARKAGKLKMIKTSTGHSRFITTQQSVVEPKVLLNKEAIEAMQIVVNETNTAGQPALTKLSDNRIMLNSMNFKGEPRSKRAMRRGRRKRFSIGPAMATHACANNAPMMTSNAGVTSTTAGPMGTQLQPQMYMPHTGAAYTFTTPDETPLDEICLSLNPSPTDDASLVPVRSASSLSSHECQQPANNDMNKLLYPLISSNPVGLQDPYSIPLDFEQMGFAMATEDTPVLPAQKLVSEPQINVTLNRQMDPIKLGERQFRETQQYLNFYNYSFDTNL
ncbi:AaceriAFR461Cp [[Ashbya] aceris (nom. inval.)]|nr:AaceriAFR461Cp [[Ashbya] aceris (nom. inval.)]